MQRRTVRIGKGPAAADATDESKWVVCHLSCPHVPAANSVRRQDSSVFAVIFQMMVDLMVRDALQGRVTKWS
jgi:hypothetical protein